MNTNPIRNPLFASLSSLMPAVSRRITLGAILLSLCFSLTPAVAQHIVDDCGLNDNMLTPKTRPAPSGVHSGDSGHPADTETRPMGFGVMAAVQTWNCGAVTPASVTASLSDTGVLTISGNGTMANYGFGTAPWYDSRSSIKSIVVNAGVTSIGTLAFYNFGALNTVSLPATLTTIGSQAFYYSALSAITIPAGVTTIGTWAFARSPKFTSISVDAANAAYRSINGVLYNASGTSLLYYPEGKNDRIFTVPHGVTTIGQYAFMETKTNTVVLPEGLTAINAYAFDSSKIVSIILPSSITTIGSNAFDSCNSLKSITCGNAVPLVSPKILANTFDSVDLRKVTLAVPASAITAYDNAPVWCDIGAITDLESYVDTGADVIYAPIEGASSIIYINTAPGAAWSLTSDSSWAAPSRTAASNPGMVTITTAANAGAGRQAKINIRVGDKMRTVTIIQGANLGNGISLLGDSLVTVTVNSTQWNNLTTLATFGTELRAIATQIYAKFKDDFDFVFFVLDTPSDNTINEALRFSGVNMGGGSPWGSAGKLQSAMYCPYDIAMAGGPALHELCHNWAAYCCTTYDRNNIVYTGHWGISNAGGQLGGFNHVRVVEQNSGGMLGKTKYQASFDSNERNPDGSFKYPGFGENANGGNALPFSDIELYLMGLKSDSELRSANFKLDIYSGNSVDSNESFWNGYFYSTTVTSYSIDNIKSMLGAYAPNIATSQKHFKVLTIAISKSGAGTNNYAEIIQAANWFAGPINDTTYSNVYSNIYNFRQATYNRGSLETGSLNYSLKMPSFAAQPQAQTVAPGQNATFAVAAAGNPTPALQWQYSTTSGVSWANVTAGAPYSGVTSATLMITNAAATMNGYQYRCVATNASGSATSYAATITVKPDAIITTQPASVTINASQNATFAITTTGAPIPTCQWQFSANGQTWTNIDNNTVYSGATTTTLNITAATAGMNAYRYRCLVTNTTNTATSDIATLSVNYIPTIITQPASQARLAGQAATFAIASTGKPTPTYQWQISTDGSSWTDLAGATGDTCYVYNITAIMHNNGYRCVITNAVGSITSDIATLTVASTPTISSQPANVTINAGSSTSFTSAASSNPAPTYQWQISTNGYTWTDITDGAPYSGATTSTLGVDAVTTAMNNYRYRCIATNTINSSNYTATSNAAILTVNYMPAITTQPINKLINAGQNASLTIAVTGNPTPTLQWQVSSNSGGTWTNIAGATTTTLSLTAVTGAMHNNQYRCVATNAAGSAISNAATLTVGVIPTITTHPVSATILATQGATFSVAATSNTTLTYQWQVTTDGTNWYPIGNDTVYSGVSTTTLTVTNATTSMTGYKYRCAVYTAAGNAPSNAATLTVNAAPIITSHPANRTVNAGQAATFTIYMSGTPLPACQWQVSSNNGSSWTNITGATATTLSLTAVTGSMHNNQYRCVATNAAGSANSNAATLTVVVIPTITTHPANATILATGNATFTVAATGNTTLTYRWQGSTDGVNWYAIGNDTVYSGVTTPTLTITNAPATMSGFRYRCNVSTNAGIAPSNAATLTVNAVPTITYQPANSTANAGQNASFYVSTAGTPAPSLQWQVSTNSGTSWTNIAGAANTALTLTAVTGEMHNNQYRCVVTNAAGSAISNAVTLAVTVIPTFTTHPVSATILATQGATFTAAANSNTTHTYYWQYSIDGTNWYSVPSNATYSGASTPTLTITNATTSMTGYKYRCSAYTSAGTGSSNAATLTVNAVPAITYQPANVTVNAGLNANFYVSTTGTPPPSLQWQVSTNNGTTWTDIAGATSTPLALTAVTAQMHNNQYRCVATNAAGSATSNAVTLTVNNIPVITVHPTDVSRTVGQTGTFTVTATSELAMNYQWYVTTNGGSSWGYVNNNATYSGAQSATLTIANTTLTMNSYQYRCYISNSVGGANSNVATLSVGSGPAISTQPVSATVASGQNATFTVTATATPAPTYQWKISTDNGATWTNIAGATNATLTLNSVTTAMNNNRYHCLVTNTLGTTTSSAATLTVGELPAITTQPANTTINAGQNTTLTTAWTGTPAPTHQWQISINNGGTWTNLVNGAPYSGATTATLTITAATAALHNNQYRCVATNNQGNVNSNAATLTVNSAPAITTQPANQSVLSGQNATFTIAATGNPALSYQWQSSPNGTAWTDITNAAPYSGATSATLNVTGVTITLNNYQHRCVITNSAGTVTSTAATLTIGAIPAITTQPANTTIAAGENATFTIAASGNPAPTYQWQISANNGSTWTNLANGAPYSGVTTATLTITAAPGALNNNQYRCIATNTQSGTPTTATSNAAILTVTYLPAITTQPANQSALSGQNATFAVVATGNPSVTYQWQSSPNGTAWTDITDAAPYSGAKSATLTITGATLAINNHQYRCVITNSVASVNSTAATLTIGEPAAITPHPTSTTITAGQNTTLTIAASGNPAPTYQWQITTNNGGSWTNLANGAPYSGVTTATLTITAATAALNSNQYRCVVTNTPSGTPVTATSNAAILTVNYAPTITTHPVSQSILAGQNATFIVSATGNPSPAYQWQISTGGTASWTDLTSAAPYSIATSTLTITAATTALGGNQYRARAHNTIGSADGNAATLTVGASPSNLTQLPSQQPVAAGRNASFLASASGTPAPTYRWQVSTNGGSSWTDLTNTGPYSGVNTSKLTITGVTATMNGYRYQYIADNGLGSPLTSNAATLTVTTAVFTNPVAITLDTSRNLYVADANTIHKITTQLVATTFAGAANQPGTLDGTGTLARLNQPRALAFNQTGDLLVADTGNASIRKITTAGAVTTIATGFAAPAGISLDATGKAYIADSTAHTVHQLSSTNTVSLYAGASGTSGAIAAAGADAHFKAPTHTLVDNAGHIYIADTGNHVIRTTSTNGVMLLYVGLATTTGTADGDLADARLDSPRGMAADSQNNIYFADTGNSTIRMFTYDGEVMTVAGKPGVAGMADGIKQNALFDHPTDVAFDGNGNLYVADAGNAAIRRIILSSGDVTTLIITTPTTSGTTTPPPPPPSGGGNSGGGGGGGAPTLWYLAALTALLAASHLRSQIRSHRR